MTEAAYDDLRKIIRYNACPEIIVTFGSKGRQIAATRIGRAGVIQCRIWRASSCRWTKWRKLQIGEIVGFAAQADRDKFKPDYGLAWERLNEPHGHS
jgi:hypothetical protein